MIYSINTKTGFIKSHSSVTTAANSTNVSETSIYRHRKTLTEVKGYYFTDSLESAQSLAIAIKNKNGAQIHTFRTTEENQTIAFVTDRMTTSRGNLVNFELQFVDRDPSKFWLIIDHAERGLPTQSVTHEMRVKHVPSTWVSALGVDIPEVGNYLEMIRASIHEFVSTHKAEEFTIDPMGVIAMIVSYANISLGRTGNRLHGRFPVRVVRTSNGSSVIEWKPRNGMSDRLDISKHLPAFKTLTSKEVSKNDAIVSHAH